MPALAKGRTSRPDTPGPAGKNARPLCGGSGTHSITLSVRACRRSPNPPHIGAIADSAAETPERWVAPGSRRGSHGEERRHPLLNVRRSCSAVSAPIRQAGAPPPPMGMRERFQNQIPFNVSQGRTDQPFGQTAARPRGNRCVRRHASHCATPVHNAHRAHHQRTTTRLMIS